MKNPSALIIEDANYLATKFSRALRVAGFETEIALDGNTALERLAATTPDLVVLDIHLPYVSGADILHQIRADERLAETRVIIITADPFRAEPLRREADLVLLKPINFSQFRDLAARLWSGDTIAQG